MNRSEILESIANTPAPKPPALTSAKIAEAERVRLEVEAYIASGGNYEVVDSTQCRYMTAREQMNANYKKDVLNGKVMDKPLKSKK